MGPSFRVTKQRGQLLDGPAGSGARLLATLHPSAVLRGGDQQDEMYEGFVQDLRVAATALRSG
jgi:DNA polymerase